MRIRTDGDYAHRLDAIESAMQAPDKNARTGAVIVACEHARQDRKAKRKALTHPDMTPALAEILSTSVLQLSYETHTSVNTR